MPLTQSKPRSFVLKIWFEQTKSSREAGEWRLHLTDVTTFERRYFRRLDDLLGYLKTEFGETEGPDTISNALTTHLASRDTEQIE